MSGRQKYKGWVFILALTIVFTVSSRAQLLQVKAWPAAQSMEIGEQLLFHIEVIRHLDAMVTLPYFEDKLGTAVEIIKVGDIDSIVNRNEGHVTLRQQLTITAFETGRLGIPPLPFVLAHEKGTDTIYSSSAFIEVKAFPVDEGGDLRDIKPIEKVPMRFSELLPYLIALQLVVAIMLVVLHLVRKRKSGGLFFERPKPTEPAHIVALRELEGLKAEKLWQRGETKMFYTRLTDILRLYIWNRFQIMALEFTTQEILVALRAVITLSPEMDKELEQLLRDADLVKFARATPLPDENDHHLDAAFNLVISTKQVPELSEDKEVIATYSK